MEEEEEDVHYRNTNESMLMLFPESCYYKWFRLSESFLLQRNFLLNDALQLQVNSSYMGWWGGRSLGREHP